MKPALVILAFGSLAAYGQSTVIGTIKVVSATEIRLTTPRGAFTVYAGGRTEVVKETKRHDFSPLKVGDEISVHCESGNAGRLVAIQVWANVVRFRATVKHVEGDNIEVVTTPSADWPREEHKIVHLYADTALSSDRKNLSEGQDLHVVGLDVESGEVDAARIAMSNTDLPVTK